MKRKALALFILFLLVMPLAGVYGYAFEPEDDDYLVPDLATLEEYLEWVKDNPPVGGITWDKFSVLGEYTPRTSDNRKDSATYLYQYGERTYYLYVCDLSSVKQYKWFDPDYDDAIVEKQKEYWKPYLPIIDQMTTKEFLNVENNRPETINIPAVVWIESSDFETTDLTVLPHNKAKAFSLACLDNNLVFGYRQESGLATIEWIHNGIYYLLWCQDESVVFNETDVDIVRRLTNLETCEEALNELMSEISDNAVAEMPKGMPRDELTGGSNDGSGENSGGDTTVPDGDTTDTGENAIGSDENEENKDSKTESVLPWVFLGAAGVLVLATALGILLHSRKKH